MVSHRCEMRSLPIHPDRLLERCDAIQVLLPGSHIQACRRPAVPRAATARCVRATVPGTEALVNTSTSCNCQVQQARASPGIATAYTCAAGTRSLQLSQTDGGLP